MLVGGDQRIVQAHDRAVGRSLVKGNPWVIPGQKPGAHMTNLDGPWRIVRGRARIEDVGLHDCRHSFASRALALGESLPAIAKLLGHSQVQTTARYAHLARDSVRASAARVVASIEEDFLGTAPNRRRRTSRRAVCEGQVGYREQSGLGRTETIRQDGHGLT